MVFSPLPLLPPPPLTRGQEPSKAPVAPPAVGTKRQAGLGVVLGTGPVTALGDALMQGRVLWLRPRECGREGVRRKPQALSPNAAERGGDRAGVGCCCPSAAASELLQAAIHLSLALFPSPGPALGAKLLQVFLKVLMVHGPVAGGLTVRLGDKAGEVREHLPLS